MDAKADIQKITVDGKDYVPVDAIQEFDGPIKIVILQRSWCMVGRFERTGSDCQLHNAAVIRTWGTSKGLGEIALNGPTSSTKLDKTNGLVEFDYLTVVATLSCKESKWESEL